MTKPTKSRTIWLGGVISTLGVVQVFAPALPIHPLYQGLLAIVVGLLIVVLRYDTHDSIGSDE